MAFGQYLSPVSICAVVVVLLANLGASSTGAEPQTESTNLPKTGFGKTVDSKEVDFGPYMADMQRRIRKVWRAPKTKNSTHAVVIYKIHTNGSVSHLRLSKSSGVLNADKAALKAIKEVVPLRPLPVGAPPNIDIQFSFDYNVFNRTPTEHELRLELAGLERKSDKDNLRLAHILYSLAEFDFKKSKYSEAEALLKRSLAIYEKEPGNNDQKNVVYILDELANCYGRKNQSAIAKPLLERSLKIREQVFASDPDSLLQGFINLASCCFHQKDNTTANQLLGRALEICLQDANADNQESSGRIENLAKVYRNYGDYVGLKVFYERVLAEHEKIQPARNSQIVQDLENLAGCYIDEARSAGSVNKPAADFLSKYEQAKLLLERALAIEETIPPGQQAELDTILVMLGKCDYAKGLHEPALSRFERALAVREKTFGTANKVVQEHLDRLAGLYVENGDIKKAEGLYLNALDLSEKETDSKESSLISSLDRLGSFYCQFARYADAEPYFQRALAKQEKVLGPLDPDTVETRKRLFYVFAKLGKKGQQEYLYRNLVSRYQENKSSSSDLANSLSHLAWCYCQLGRYADAEISLRQELNIRTKMPKNELEAMAANIQNLAVVSEQLNKTAQAEALYKQLVAVCSPPNGLNAHDQLSATEQLASYYWRQRKFIQAEPLIKRERILIEKLPDNDYRDIYKRQFRERWAWFYYSCKNYPIAESLFKKEIAGVGYPAVSLINGLAAIYTITKKKALAEQLYLHEIARWLKYGQNSGIANGLIHCYLESGQPGKAELWLTQNMKDKDSIQRWAPDLALAFYKQKNYSAAEHTYSNILESLKDREWTAPSRGVEFIATKVSQPDSTKIRGWSSSAKTQPFGYYHPWLYLGGEYRNNNRAKRYEPIIYELPVDALSNPSVCDVYSSNMLVGFYIDKNHVSMTRPAAQAYFELQLANVYRDDGRYSLAEPLYTKLIVFFKENDNPEKKAFLMFSYPDEPEYLYKSVLTSYATMLRKANRASEAQAMESQVKGMK